MARKLDKYGGGEGKQTGGGRDICSTFVRAGREGDG
jgi:hypothetical protein